MSKKRKVVKAVAAQAGPAQRSFSKQAIWLAVLVAVIVGALTFKFTHRPSATRTAATPRPTPVAAPTPSTLAELLALPATQLENCDIGLMNLLCAEGLRGSEQMNATEFSATMDLWAQRIAYETERHQYRFEKTPGEYEHSPGYFRMLMLAVVLQEDFKIHYNSDRITPFGVFEPNNIFFADSRDVFIHGLLGERRTGTCSSMPVLYVAVGRRLGYPLKLVAGKNHLFVRWEDASERFNVEATSRGCSRHDDAHYRRVPFSITEEEIQTFGFLRSLTAAEELSIFLSMRAMSFAILNRWDEAVQIQEHAARLAPNRLEGKIILTEMQRERDYQHNVKIGLIPSREELEQENFLRQVDRMNREKRGEMLPQPSVAAGLPPGLQSPVPPNPAPNVNPFPKSPFP